MWRKRRSAPPKSLDEQFGALAKRLGAWGCTAVEIDLIERDHPVPLPPSYRRFLETMGRDAGGLLGGSALSYHEVIGVRKVALDLVAETSTAFCLPDDAVVISVHQGYQFMYLRSSEGDDPPVRWWSEVGGGAEPPTMVATSLLELLVADEQSTMLPTKRRDQHRRATANGRRSRFAPHPPCPACGGPMATYNFAMYRAGIRDSGRTQVIGVCPSCREEFCRWADVPGHAWQRRVSKPR